MYQLSKDLFTRGFQGKLDWGEEEEKRIGPVAVQSNCILAPVQLLIKGHQ